MMDALAGIFGIGDDDIADSDFFRDWFDRNKARLKYDQYQHRWFLNESSVAIGIREELAEQ